MDSTGIIAMLAGLAFLLFGGTGMVSPHTLRRIGEEMQRWQDSMIKGAGIASILIAHVVFLLVLKSVTPAQAAASAAGALLFLFGILMIYPNMIKAIVKEYQYLPDNRHILFSGLFALLGIVVLYAALR